MDYERGLEQLKQIAQGSDWYLLFTIYEARLLDILEKNTLFGTSPQSRELNEVIYDLNKLSYKKLQISFNDLCTGTFFNKKSSQMVNTLQSTQEYTTGMAKKSTHPTEIFIGYSTKDQDYFEKFVSHLTPYLRRNMFHIWSHNHSTPGGIYIQENQQALAKANLAVLLISADYLSSDRAENFEMRPLIEAAHAGRIRLLNILLRPTRGFQDSGLDSFSLLNTNERPMSSMTPSEQEALWGKVIDLLLSK